jgi:proline iminopeptidase
LEQTRPLRLGAVEVTLPDGYGMLVEEVGEGFPLVVLHGGPGMDHSMFRPWLDPLGDEFRLLYVDERGQGRSTRVDPATLSLEVFARDVDLLAEALRLDRFALLGHSFGAIVATWHATELDTAAAYVISGGAEASEPLLADVEASLEALGERRRAIADSWEMEQDVQTEEELAELMRVQMPFHFQGEPPPGFGEETVYSPDVLRHFARIGYGDFDYRPRLGSVRSPTLVVVGEHDRTTTVRAARALHDGIEGSDLVVIPGVGHMSFVEAQEPYLDAVRTFLRRASRT